MVNLYELCLGIPTTWLSLCAGFYRITSTWWVPVWFMNSQWHSGGLAPILFQRLKQQSYYWKPIVSSLFATEGVVTPAKQDSSGTGRARRCIAASHEFLSCNTVNTSTLLSAPLYYPDIFKRSQNKGATYLKDNYICKQPYDIYHCGI